MFSLVSLPSIKVFLFLHSSLPARGKTGLLGLLEQRGSSLQNRPWWRGGVFLCLMSWNLALLCKGKTVSKEDIYICFEGLGLCSVSEMLTTNSAVVDRLTH